MRSPFLVFSAFGTLCALAADLYEETPHKYSESPPDDPIALLAEKVKNGTIKLTEGSDRELTEDLLTKLQISPHSQVLVFSKTSLQRDKINPGNPRAIYFNDETYVGWVPGGSLEFTGLHPSMGAFFYHLDPETPSRPRQITRQNNCLSCHGGGMTDHYPGVMIRSLAADDRGFPLLQNGSVLVDHTTPIKDRWGGWFVTGSTGPVRHQGNVISAETKTGVQPVGDPSGNLETLSALARIRDVKQYLSPSSDVVALMVLEHQITIQQRLTVASYEMRAAIHRMQALQRDMGEPVTETLTGSALSVAKNHTEKILQALLFCGEAVLPEGGIQGNPAFVEAFQANRKKSSNGKSLKDLQLLTRLFKYRCSYQIYSRQFLGLPPALKSMIYERLKAILQANEPEATYAHLCESERKAIWEILSETHPEAEKNSF